MSTIETTGFMEKIKNYSIPILIAGIVSLAVGIPRYSSNKNKRIKSHIEDRKDLIGKFKTGETPPYETLNLYGQHLISALSELNKRIKEKIASCESNDEIITKLNTEFWNEKESLEEHLTEYLKKPDDKSKTKYRIDHKVFFDIKQPLFQTLNETIDNNRNSVKKINEDIDSAINDKSGNLIMFQKDSNPDFKNKLVYFNEEHDPETDLSINNKKNQSVNDYIKELTKFNEFANITDRYGDLDTTVSPNLKRKKITDLNQKQEEYNKIQTEIQKYKQLFDISITKPPDIIDDYIQDGDIPKTIQTIEIIIENEKKSLTSTTDDKYKKIDEVSKQYKNFKDKFSLLKVEITKLKNNDASYNEIKTDYVNNAKDMSFNNFIKYGIKSQTKNIDEYIDKLENHDTSVLNNLWGSGDTNMISSELKKESERVKKLYNNIQEKYQIISNIIQNLYYIREASLDLLNSIYEYILVIYDGVIDKIKDSGKPFQFITKIKSMLNLFLTTPSSAPNINEFKEIQKQIKDSNTFKECEELSGYFIYAISIHQLRQYIDYQVYDNYSELLNIQSGSDSEDRWSFNTYKIIYPTDRLSYRDNEMYYNKALADNTKKYAEHPTWVNWLSTTANTGWINVRKFLYLNIRKPSKDLISNILSSTSYYNYDLDTYMNHVAYLAIGSNINTILDKNIYKKDYIIRLKDIDTESINEKAKFIETWNIDTKLVDKIQDLKKKLIEYQSRYYNFLLNYDDVMNKLYIKFPELAPIISVFDAKTGEYKVETKQVSPDITLGKYDSTALNKNLLFGRPSLSRMVGNFFSNRRDITQGYGIGDGQSIYLKRDLKLNDFLSNHIYDVYNSAEYNKFLLDEDEDYRNNKHIPNFKSKLSPPTPVKELWVGSTKNIYIFVVEQSLMKELIQILHKCIQTEIMGAKTIDPNIKIVKNPVNCQKSSDVTKVSVSLRNPTSKDDDSCRVYDKNKFLKIPKYAIDALIKNIEDLRTKVDAYHKTLSEIKWMPTSETTLVNRQEETYIEDTQKSGSEACKDIVNSIIKFLADIGKIKVDNLEYKNKLSINDNILFLLNYDRNGKYFTKLDNTKIALNILQYPIYSSVPDYPSTLINANDIYKFIAFAYGKALKDDKYIHNKTNGLHSDYVNKYDTERATFGSISNRAIIDDFQDKAANSNADYFGNKFLDQTDFNTINEFLKTLTCKYTPVKLEYKTGDRLGYSLTPGDGGQTDFNTNSSMPNWVDYLAEYLDFEKNPQLIQQLFIDDNFKELNERSILANIYDNINTIIGYQVHPDDSNIILPNEEYKKKIMDLLVNKDRGWIDYFMNKNSSDKPKTQIVHFLKTPLIKLYAINALSKFEIENLSIGMLDNITNNPSFTDDAAKTNKKNELVNMVKSLKTDCLKLLITEFIHDKPTVKMLTSGIIKIFNYFFNKTEDIKRTIIYLKMFSYKLNKYIPVSTPPTTPPTPTTPGWANTIGDRTIEYKTKAGETKPIQIKNATQGMELERGYINTYIKGAFGDIPFTFDRKNMDQVNKLLVYCLCMHHKLFVVPGLNPFSRIGADALIDFTLDLLIHPAKSDMKIDPTKYHNKAKIIEDKEQKDNNDAITEYLKHSPVNIQDNPYIGDNNKNVIERIKSRLYLYNIPREIKNAGGSFKISLNSLTETNTADVNSKRIIKELMDNRSTYPYYYLISKMFNITDNNKIKTIFKHIFYHYIQNETTLKLDTDTTTEYNKQITETYNSLKTSINNQINDKFINIQDGIGVYNINTNLDIPITISEYTSESETNPKITNKLGGGGVEVIPTFKPYEEPDNYTRERRRTHTSTGKNKRKINLK